jgi:hypothetical protein
MSSSPGGTDALGGLTKLGVAVLAGAAIAGSATMLKPDRRTMMIIVVGMAAAVVLLGLYRLLLKWVRSRRSRPFSAMVTGAAGGAPNAITNPAQRAALDDLRRSFESGVTKFQAAGKDLYSLPWYLLVGEPGSGKTEAIRHCNVGFPPGLQDQLQGAGGTVNMNWWFTNHAVILDTAGRLLFQEVEPGGIGEWPEFLKLLVRNRPDCPINGLLLVIPADSLIKDTADEIERKAGKIAQQLDLIQRSIGVRFPVFTVVTKCDLIVGFREFFDGLRDPRLQHQILGWSNPAPLDQAFEPSQVDQHLESVRDRLSRRRLGLLIDPINTEDPEARRTDQVDALYSFPDSLIKIAPRLRRYLEMIFVAGEWSPKPLFLRGIYFTSSVRQGSALDQELAEMLRVPVESLPEGRVWERDRAYFLRDLFLEKVFRERGLVTRASNTQSLQRQRRVAVLGFGFAAVVLLLGFTWLGSRQLDDSIRDQSDYWSGVANRLDKETGWPVVERDISPAAATQSAVPAYRTRLTDTLNLGHKIDTVGDFHTATQEDLKDRIDVPWVLKPAAFLINWRRDVNDDRGKAYAALYVRDVLVPVVKAARDKLAAETPATWTAASTAALAQLVRIEAKAEADVKPAELEPLFRYVLADEKQFAGYRKYKEPLGEGLKLLGPSPMSALPASEASSPPRLAKGVQTFVDHWNARGVAQTERLGAMRSIGALLPALAAADQTLLSTTKQLHLRPPATRPEYAAAHAQWRAAFDKFKAVRQDLLARLAALKALKWSETQPLAEYFDAENRQSREQADKAFAALLAELPKEPAAPALQTAKRQLIAARAKLQELPKDVTTLAADLATLDRTFLRLQQGTDNKQQRMIEFACRAYEAADAQLPPPTARAAMKPESQAVTDAGADAWSAAGTAVEAVDKAIEEFRYALVKPAGDAPDVAAARDLIVGNTDVVVYDLAAPMRRNLVIAAALADAPQQSAAVQEAVVRRQDLPGAFPPPRRPKVPMTESRPFDLKFNPKAAASILNSATSVAARLAPPPAPVGPGGGTRRVNVIAGAELAAAYQAGLGRAAEAYIEDYVKYWEVTRFTQPRLEAQAWADVIPLLPDDADDANGKLEELAIEVESALLAVEGHAAATAVRKRITDAQGRIEAGRAKFGDRAILARGNFRKRLTAWRALFGKTPAAARNAVLALKGVDFRERYLLLASDDPDFVTAYWGRMSQECLRTLADQSGDLASAARKRMAQYEKFPFGAVSDGPLPPEDVDALQKLLAEIAPATAEKKGEDFAIGAGGRLGDEEADPLLDRLCGLELKPADRDRLERWQRMANVLPMAGRSIRCKVFVAPAGANDVFQANAVRVKQGANLLNKDWQRLGLGTAVEIGTAGVPGPPLEFEFSRVLQNAKPDGAVKVSAGRAIDSWHLLALVKQLNGQPARNATTNEPDLKTWVVRLPVADPQGNWSFRVMLQFTTELPPLEQWP